MINKYKLLNSEFSQESNTTTTGKLNKLNQKIFPTYKDTIYFEKERCTRTNP